ncbi:outer membrane lipoprotein carrier protein LolA [Geobacter sp. DSM 9736]|uniref:LolA family protein n=1 Tax=Geobacter sp. DSM 9736 TaxID=1277350 RepID=UPI000B603382|nr:outer membrane lipoprotein carrier protein LolA [Geobacter sp. DSM 9736]SNB47650.1 outer membrane lipoprotein carrier protein [Geobacter sp. DSM 9736]
MIRFKNIIETALFLSLLLLFPASVPAATQLPALEGLELVRRGMTGMNDFTADITQEKQIALLKKKLVSTGSMKFRRPDLFFMEMKPPYASRMLLRDNVLTMMLPAENVRQQTVLPPEEGLLRWFRLLDKPVTKVPEGMGVRAEKSGNEITLVMVPAGKRGVRELKLTIQDDGRPRRLLLIERNGDRTDILFRNVKRNVGLTDKDFKID